jgi:hypothetical protein
MAAVFHLPYEMLEEMHMGRVGDVYQHPNMRHPPDEYPGLQRPGQSVRLSARLVR